MGALASIQLIGLKHAEFRIVPLWDDISSETFVDHHAKSSGSNIIDSPCLSVVIFVRHALLDCPISLENQYK